MRCVSWPSRGFPASPRTAKFSSKRILNAFVTVSVCKHGDLLVAFSYLPRCKNSPSYSPDRHGFHQYVSESFAADQFHVESNAHPRPRKSYHPLFHFPHTSYPLPHYRGKEMEKTTAVNPQETHAYAPCTSIGWTHSHGSAGLPVESQTRTSGHAEILTQKALQESKKRY